MNAEKQRIAKLATLRAERDEAQTRVRELEGVLLAHARGDVQFHAIFSSEHSAEIVRLSQDNTTLRAETARLREAVMKIKTAWDNEDGTAKTELAVEDAITAALKEDAK